MEAILMELSETILKLKSREIQSLIRVEFCRFFKWLLVLTLLMLIETGKLLNLLLLLLILILLRLLIETWELFDLLWLLILAMRLLETRKLFDRLLLRLLVLEGLLL